MSTLKTLQSEINNIEGKPANSASPSDIWFANTSKGELVFKITLNRNTTGYNFTNGSRLEYGEEEQAVEYEAKLYIEIINKLIDNNINPFFVKCEEVFFKVPFRELLNFHNVFGMKKCLFRNKLLRNTLYMSLVTEKRYRFKNRPSIDEVSPFHTPIQVSALLNNEENIEALIKSYSIMHNMEEFDSMLRPTELFYNIIVTSKTTDSSLSSLHMNNKLTANGKLNRMGWTVIIQILTALSTLEILKIAHNDLHMGNILIEDTNENIKYFKFDNFHFRLNSNLNCKIYDWDRAYSSQHGENNLLDYYCDSSQCNEYVPQREATKFFVYFIKSPLLDQQEKILLASFLISDSDLGQKFARECGTLTDFLICTNTKNSLKRKDYEEYGFQTPRNILLNVLNHVNNDTNLGGIVETFDIQNPPPNVYNITEDNVQNTINSMEL